MAYPLWLSPVAYPLWLTPCGLPLMAYPYGLPLWLAPVSLHALYLSGSIERRRFLYTCSYTFSVGAVGASVEAL